MKIYFDYGTGWEDVTRYIRDDIKVTQRAGTDDFHYAQNVCNLTMKMDSPPFVPTTSGMLYYNDSFTSDSEWVITVSEDTNIYTRGGVRNTTVFNIQPNIKYLVRLELTANQASNISLIGKTSSGTYRIIGNTTMVKGTNIVSFMVESDVQIVELGLVWDSLIPIEITKMYVGDWKWVSNYDKLKNADEVKVKVVDESNTVFTGIISNKPSIPYDGMYELLQLQLEATDRIRKLEVSPDEIVLRNAKISDYTNKSQSIIHQLAYNAGFTNADIADFTINTTISGFATISGSDSILSIMDTLLYENGFVLHMDENDTIKPIQWILPSGTTPVYTFTGRDIFPALEYSENEKEYNKVEVTYYNVGEKPNVLLYKHSVPEDSNGLFTGYPVISGYYYPIEANIINDETGLREEVWFEYQDTSIKALTNKAIVEKLDYDPRTAMKAFKSDYSAIICTSGHYLDYRADAGLDLLSQTFKNNKAQVLFKNNTSESKKIYYLNLYGNVLYKTAERKTTVGEDLTKKKTNAYTSKYVYDSLTAKNLAVGLYQISQNNGTYTFSSFVDVPIGSYVYLNVPRFETYGIVLEKTYDILNGIFNYKIRQWQSVNTQVSTSIISNPDINTTNFLKLSILSRWCAIYDELNVTTVLTDDISHFVQGQYCSTIQSAKNVGVAVSDMQDYIDAVNQLRDYLWNPSTGILKYSTIISDEQSTADTYFATCTSKYNNLLNAINYKLLQSIGIVANLSNDNHTVPTDANGNNGNYTGCATTMSIFYGPADDSANWTVAASPSTGVTGSLSGKTYTVTAMSVDSGYVDLTASRTGYPSLTLRFTIAKAKGGAAFWLVSSADAIQKSQAGVYTPSTITFTGKGSASAGVIGDYYGRFVIAETTDGSSYTDKYTSLADEMSKTYTPSAGIKALRCRLYLAGGTTTLLDEEIVPIVTDGPTGPQGVPGADGADGVNARGVNLTTTEQAFTYDTAGANPSPSSATITAIAVNTSGTVYYEFFKNDISVQNTTSNTYAYTPQASFVNMPDKIEVQIREGSSSGTILARDQITIVGVKAGAHGITPILSNASHTVPADNSGNVTSYTGSGTTIQVYEGSTALQYNTTLAAGKFTIGTPTISPSGKITVGSITGSETTTATVAQHSAMDSATDLVTITYPVTARRADGTDVTLSLVQTITKSKAGATGPQGPDAPRYLGAYLDSSPLAAHEGDVYLRYSMTPNTTGQHDRRGVFRYTDGVWTFTTAPADMYLAIRDIADICSILSNDGSTHIYGIEADYGVTEQIDVAHIKTALIDFLRGGDAYFSGDVDMQNGTVRGILATPILATTDPTNGDTINAPPYTHWDGSTFVSHCSSLSDGWIPATGTFASKNVTYVVKSSNAEVSLQSDDDIASVAGTTWVTVASLTSSINGKVKFYAKGRTDYYGLIPLNTGYWRVLVNGVVVNDTYGHSIVYTDLSFSQLYNLSIGDVVTLQVHSNNDQQAHVKDFRISPAPGTIGVYNNTDNTTLIIDSDSYYTQTGNIAVSGLSDFVASANLWQGSVFINSFDGKIRGSIEQTVSGTFNGKSVSSIYITGDQYIRFTYSDSTTETLSAIDYYTYTGSITLPTTPGKTKLRRTLSDDGYDLWADAIPDGSGNVQVLLQNKISGQLHSLFVLRAPIGNQTESTYAQSCIVTNSGQYIDWVHDLSFHNYSGADDMKFVDVIMCLNAYLKGHWQWVRKNCVSGTAYGTYGTIEEFTAMELSGDGDLTVSRDIAASRNITASNDITASGTVKGQYIQPTTNYKSVDGSTGVTGTYKMIVNVDGSSVYKYFVFKNGILTAVNDV